MKEELEDLKIVKIEADKICANSITADKLDVNVFNYVLMRAVLNFRSWLKEPKK